MSSSSPSSYSSSLLISVVIAAMALYPLCISSPTTGSTGTTKTTAWEAFADLFFGLTMIEQMAVMALIFSVSFACASFGTTHATTTATGTATDKTTTTTSPKYPLELIASLDNDTEKFKALYPMLRDELLLHLKTQHELLPEALEWVQAMLDYTVPGGKLNRGITVISVQRTLMQSSIAPSKNTTTTTKDCLSHTALCQAAALGWAIEFLQAFFLVADDVMDESQTRRGQPCWYKKDSVQMIAINDSFLLESFVFSILKQHFLNTPYYHDLVDLFLIVIQKTEVGQLLDLTSQPMGQTPDLDRFTLQRYRQIVKYKTAYYTFYLPIAMGMITSNLNMTRDKQIFATAERICCIMGEYFQIQDDYLDCFGTPEMIGKIGTDIQDNKCSWLIVQALDRATPAQRTLLKQNYGSWDDAKVQKVKQLYHELKLPKVFADYEESSYHTIQQELDTLPPVLPRDVFELLLKKIYKRNK